MLTCPNCRTEIPYEPVSGPSSDEGDLSLPLTVQGDEGYVYAAAWDTWTFGPGEYPTAQRAWYALAEHRDAMRIQMGYQPDEDSATIRHYGDTGMVGATEIKMHSLGQPIRVWVERVKKGK